MSRRLLHSALAALWLPGAALAQPATAPDSAASAAEPTRPLLPGIKLPELTDLKAAVPRPVQAVTALMGLGTPRLALVIGNSLLGSETALGAAPRDTQAVAAALRAGGFVVMVREDLGADDLRANLKEFHDRLQPDSLGLLYFTGLGLQLDGQNLVLPRGPRPAAGLAGLRAAAVPLQELIDAAQGTDRSPRFLVVDAAFSHDALAGLPKPGLAQQRLPPGMMALFSSAPDAALAPPAAPSQSTTTDPRQIAASSFARELVRSLLTPRRSGAEVLRQTRSAVLEASQGKQSPWIEGDNTDKSDFAEPDLLDALLPRSPQELARDAARLALRINPQRSATAAAAQAGEALSPMVAPAPPPLPPDAAADLAARTATQAAGAAAGAATTAVTSAANSTATGAAAALVTVAAGAAASLISAAGDMPVSAFASPPPPPKPAPAPPPPQPIPSPPPTPPQAAPAPAAPAPPAPSRGVGERPNWTPRVNPFGYAEGDTYTYRVLDKWKNEVSSMVVQSIEEVLPDGQMRANGASTQFDAQGRIKSTRNADGSRSDYEPAQELYWPNPRRGEKRSVDFGENFQRADRSSGHTEWSGSMSVGRATKIQLPAGEFEVVPIEGGGWYTTKSSTGPFSGQWSRTVWYSTKLGHPVAIDIEDADRTGRLLRRERVELVHAQTQRSSH